MDDDWLLGLPGLRRYGERIKSLSRQVKILEERTARQALRVADLRAKLACKSRETAKLRPLRERLLRQEARTGQLRDHVTVLQARLQRNVKRNARDRSRILSVCTLEHTLPARKQALLASGRSEMASQRQAEFSAVSPAYAAAVKEKDTLVAEMAVDQADICGLTIWMPRTASQPGNLAHRLINRRLPFEDILAGRELAVGTAMIDIGANVGTTSIPRVVAGDVQMVYAAEPDPLNYACLVKNVCENGLQGLVIPDQVAISDSDGTAVLFRSGGLGTQRLLLGGCENQVLDSGTQVQVPTVTLDRWAERLRIEPALVCCVKSDTQGWESHVLAGARQLLEYRHIAWVIEFSPRHLLLAGSGVDRLIGQMQDHFTHFVDLRGTAVGRRVREVAELPAAVAYITEREERRFTDLLLYSA